MVESHIGKCNDACQVANGIHSKFCKLINSNLEATEEQTSKVIDNFLQNTTLKSSPATDSLKDFVRGANEAIKTMNDMALQAAHQAGEMTKTSFQAVKNASTSMKNKVAPKK
jgi:polyhydroxyalkanoate synthesis regulator phasin